MRQIPRTEGHLTELASSGAQIPWLIDKEAAARELDKPLPAEKPAGAVILTLDMGLEVAVQWRLSAVEEAGEAG